MHLIKYFLSITYFLCWTHDLIIPQSYRNTMNGIAVCNETIFHTAFPQYEATALYKTVWILYGSFNILPPNTHQTTMVLLVAWTCQEIQQQAALIQIIITATLHKHNYKNVSNVFCAASDQKPLHNKRRVIVQRQKKAPGADHRGWPNLQ